MTKYELFDEYDQTMIMISRFEKASRCWWWKDELVELIDLLKMQKDRLRKIIIASSSPRNA